MIWRTATNLWGDYLKYDRDKAAVGHLGCKSKEVNRMKKKGSKRSRKTFILLAVICHFLAAVKCSLVLSLNFVCFITESMICRF